MRLKLLFLLSWFFISSMYAQPNMIKIQIIDGAPHKTLRTLIERNTSDLLNDIAFSYSHNNKEIYYTSEGISENAKMNINAIWSLSPFYCTKQDIKERLLKTSTGFEIRNIPVKLDSLSEEIVIELNENGNIIHVYFSVNQHQYKNFSLINNVIDETRKNIIRDFLESLRTAYMKKDIDFINMVLSDKALIVVGKVIKQTDKNSFKITDSGKHTLYDADQSSSIYKRMTKKEYIAGLQRVFASNKGIFINFEDIEIIPHRKSGYESFYGVRLKQRWQSDHYSDYGILFFVIEFRERDYPLIWVRVWQDANTTTEADQIGLGEILIQPN